jgi:hypothetical protein
MFHFLHWGFFIFQSFKKKPNWNFILLLETQQQTWLTSCWWYPQIKLNDIKYNKISPTHQHIILQQNHCIWYISSKFQIKHFTMTIRLLCGCTFFCFTWDCFGQILIISFKWLSTHSTRWTNVKLGVCVVWIYLFLF